MSMPVVEGVVMFKGHVAHQAVGSAQAFRMISDRPLHIRVDGTGDVIHAPA